MTTIGSPSKLPALDPQAAALWDKLRQFSFDRGTGPRTFAVRLAEEQGWSASFTTLAIGEYRRFLLLFALDKLARADAADPGDEPPRVRVVPPAVVDKVWHLHLLYTQSYWETLCRDILGGPLHHLPAEGSADEAPTLDTVYADTLEAYRRTFGHDAPASVWPPATLPRAAGSSRWSKWVQSRGGIPGPLVMTAGLCFFAVFQISQSAALAGVFLLVMLLAAAVTGSRDARRRRGASGNGGDAGWNGLFNFGDSSGGGTSSHHHDGGHHGGHDAGGHSHSCGGGHSCGGHGCGGHGCGGGCGGH